MSDLGRCILRSVELKPVGQDRYFLLLFDRVTDTAKNNYPAIPYGVQDLGGPARKILWGKQRPETLEPLPMSDGFEAQFRKAREEERQQQATGPKG
jgi:hypothetical protein